MKTSLILDVGSCHRGDFNIAKKSISDAKMLGINMIKFQLIPRSMTGKNIYFPYEWLEELRFHGEKAGVFVFASAFDDTGIEAIQNSGCRFIKFAHSQRDNYKKLYSKKYDFSGFDKIFCSVGFMDRDMIFNNEKLLWCIPEYPVLYEIDVSLIVKLSKVFSGFSYHCFGVKQAINFMGIVEYLEVHYDPNSDDEIKCPDEMFALKYGDIKQLMNIHKG